MREAARVSSPRSYDADAVVVGAGPNGLVGAARLAAAGLRVLVLEAADNYGGGLRTEQVTEPGFHHDICSSVHPLANASPAFRNLGLHREGLAFAESPIAYAHPLSPGRGAVAYRDLERTAAELGRDGGAWRALFAPLVAHGSEIVDGTMNALSIPPAHPISMANFGIRAPWSAKLLAQSIFREEQARGLFAGLAAHATLPLSAPFTAGFALLLGALGHHVGWPVAQGGSQSIADALVARIRSQGGEVVTGYRVSTLADLPTAPITLLNLTPRQVVDIYDTALPARYRRKLERFRYGPGSFKVDWALDGPVPWTDERLADAITIHLGGSLAEITEAELAPHKGRLAESPYVLFVQATVADPSRAPVGKHTGWGYCHVPHGFDGDATETIESQIERFAPGFRERIISRHVMGPAALEAHNANEIGGDIGGGSADWRQLLTRPTISLEPWRTPLPGVFLCSASTPPGGGVHGMGGWIAAGLALRDYRERVPH